MDDPKSNPDGGLDATVFVDDDDADIRETICALIETIGLATRSYPSGPAFLAAYDGRIPGCVVLDLKLPGESGLDIQKKLSDFPVPPPVIMLTGFGDVPSSVEAMKAGAQEFLQKPYRSQDLIRSVQRCIELDRSNRDRRAVLVTTLNMIGRLTTRERQVFEMVVRGLSNKEIARELSTSPRTVEVQRLNMMRKLEVDSVAAFVRVAMEAGVKAK
jgi:FixJ family two-component response regulator